MTEQPTLAAVEDTHEGPSPYHAGTTTHRGRREDCTGPDCGPAVEEQAEDRAAVDQALAYVLITDADGDGMLTVEAGSRGLARTDTARVLREVADQLDAKAGRRRLAAVEEQADVDTAPTVADLVDAAADELLALADDVTRPTVDTAERYARAHRLAAELLAAHTRRLAADVAQKHDETRGPDGVNRSNRALLTGISSVHRLLDLAADQLDALARQ